MLLGLRTVIYRTPDIAAGKLWYTKFLGLGPISTSRSTSASTSAVMSSASFPMHAASTAGSLLGRQDITSAHARLLEAPEPSPRNDIQDVGEGIRVADVLDPFGNVLGIIENPNFKPNETEIVRLTRFQK